MQNKSIARSAARLRLALFAVVAVVAILYLAARFGLQLGRAHVEYSSDGLDERVAGLIGDGTMVLLLVALFRLTQMLRLVAAGELFSAGVIRHFRGFAFWLLLMALFGFAAPILAELLAAPVGGPRRVAIRLDLRDLLTLGLTLLLFLLARLLERARQIEQEIGEFV